MVKAGERVNAKTRNTMFKNYLKIAMRHLCKHRGYTLINMLGLSLGLACCILIVLYVQDERSYDRYHERANQIHRVAMTITSQGKQMHSASTPAPLGPAIVADYPEVIKAVRFFPLHQKTLMRHGDKRFYEEQIIVADASLLDVFSFPLVHGDARSAFDDPNGILISEHVAEKYFGQANPLGKTLTFREETDYRVTGVLKNIPSNSHVVFDIVLPLSQATITQFQYENFLHEWWDASAYTYLLLHSDASATAFQEKLPAVIEKHIGAEFRAGGMEANLFIQPLTDIYLHSHLEGELGANSHVTYIYIFTAIALLILLISIINFVNLSTARSLVRAKEVGVRKAMGAHKRQLFYQFIGESMLLAFLALGVALIVITVVLPAFNALTQKALTLQAHLPYLAGIPLLTILLGLLAGSYPALVLSSFDSLKALQGSASMRSRSGSLRRALVVFQFSISIMLIVALLVINNQKDYLQTKALGFNKEEIIVIKLTDLRLRWESETLKSALLDLPPVSQVTFSQTIPGESSVKQGYGANGIQGLALMTTLLVDDDFLQTYDIAVLTGRDFSAERPTDRTDAFIINEAAAGYLGWTSPLGKELKWGVTQKKGTVIGVVPNFHFQSLHHQIDPLVLHIEPNWYRYISVRTTTQRLAQTLTQLEEVWHRFSPAFPFDYFFLDERIGQLYGKEVQVNGIIAVFSGLAILLTCLGLFGLAAFTAQQRSKEIGVRKVLGASSASILILLCKNFAKLVMVAFVVATPLAYLAMNRWLEDFAYRIEIPWWIPLVAGSVALAIALMTVSYQAMRAALADPVRSLRSE